MKTQLLFGETGMALGSENGWLKVKLTYDDYEGWVDEKQVEPIDEPVFRQVLSASHFVALDLVHPAANDSYHLPIVAGSTLPSFDGVHFRIGKKKYIYNGQVCDTTSLTKSGELILKFASRFMNSAYLWGGRSPFGMDCSGFTQVVFKMAGIPLPRDAYQQATAGAGIDLISGARSGDLAFFENNEGRIHHVGIIENEDTILHASGWVHRSRIDHYGIFRNETANYSHKLKWIRRLF